MYCDAQKQTVKELLATARQRDAKAVKGLTLYQPWATAMAIGLKEYETRGRAWSWRGLTLIHAGKKTDFMKLTWSHPYRDHLQGYGVNKQMPMGAVVCVGRMMKSVHTGSIQVSEVEGLFGDYSEGRAAIPFEGIVALNEPVFWNGAQGLWDVPVELLEAVGEKLEAQAL